MKQFILLVIFLLAIPTIALAQSQNSIYLLTVSELENKTYQGGVASLELVITPGTGAIFIESFPLSNVDTQATTRIATDVACSYSSANCAEHDFFYTIRTNSGLVRGPSAGGATALLALTTLENINLPQMAMTGGINSGGLITSVGAIKEKVFAAVGENIPIILVPALSFNLTDNSTNQTPLLISDIQTKQKNIHKIYSLPEAFFFATGTHLPQKTLAEPPAFYTSKMKQTSQLLCERTTDLFDELSEINISSIAKNYYNQSLSTKKSGDYYSTASFCYSANVRLRNQVVEQLEYSLLVENFLRLNSSIMLFENQIDDYSLKTFSDLETYIIVKERLSESKNYMETINKTNISTSLLSVAIERYYSAVAWSGFFGLKGAPLIIDENSLELACINELRGAESRSNYLQLTIPFILLGDMQEQLSEAYVQYNNNNYPLCIFKASKAKASAHMFMNEIQSSSQLKQISEVKLKRAEELIYDQQQNDVFPIIGYSYYEYSKQLQEDQPYVSLLFTEYALSMADLSSYFPEASTRRFQTLITSELIYLLAGIFLGVIISKLIFVPGKTNKKQKSSKKNKSIKKK